MIEELLDKYAVDEFDDLLIAIIKRMQEKREQDSYDEYDFQRDKANNTSK